MSKHIHHIIPRYMGGTDDPSNLVELTVEEHAEAHRKLWEEHGDKRDWLAWRGLLGEVGKEDIIRECRSLGGKRAMEIINDGIKSGKYKRPSTQSVEFQKYRSELAKSPEARKKRKETFAKINHQQGYNNSNYGKMWIHSLEEKKSKCIDKNDPIPEGWIKGRKMKFY